MDNNKLNTEALGGELKFADSEKSADTLDAKKSVGADFLKRESKLAEKGRGNVTDIFKKKNKFPLALDIIIAVLAIALVAGAIFGAYFTFVYFSDDSDTATVEYTLLAERDESGVVAKGKDIYIDSGSNSYYIGSIVDIKENVSVENSDKEYVAIRVRVDLEYRAKEGYSTHDIKIAVGGDLTVRTDTKTYSGTVIELVRIEK